MELVDRREEARWLWQHYLVSQRRVCGLMVNGIRLSSAPKTRLKTSFGAGMQIATTHFHTYNHALVISSRVNF